MSTWCVFRWAPCDWLLIFRVVFHKHSPIKRKQINKIYKTKRKKSINVYVYYVYCMEEKRKEEIKSITCCNWLFSKMYLFRKNRYTRWYRDGGEGKGAKEIERTSRILFNLQPSIEFKTPIKSKILLYFIFLLFRNVHTKIHWDDYATQCNAR